MPAIPRDQLPIFGKSNRPPEHFDYDRGTVFLVDKPKGWTSFDMVKYLRGATGAGKVGHAGTLDPAATGLLIVCCGKATKTVGEFQDLPKEYEAEITFGCSTPSYDAETEVDQTAPTEHIERPMIETVLESEFQGTIQQIPPMYSAVKQQGERLYKKARRGEKVDRRPRSVVIHNTEIMEFNNPVLKLKVRCGKGTYIRSLARDLGDKLDSRAYLSGLERTAIGEYRVEEALSIEELRTIKF